MVGASANWPTGGLVALGVSDGGVGAGGSKARERAPRRESAPDASPVEILIDAVSDGMCLLAGDGGILYASARYAMLDSQIREKVSELARQAAWRYAQGEGVHLGAERHDMVSADGARWYEVLLSPAGPDGAGAHRVAAEVRDATASRRVQMKMLAVDEAGRDLIRLEADAVRRMNMIERLRVLESKIIKYAKTLLRFDHFAVRLIDERTGRLEMVISCGLSPEAEELAIYPRREGHGIAGYVAATGERIICNDSSKDPRFLAMVMGAKSALVVPLRVNEKLIGVLDVESLSPDAFTEEDLRAAEVFSNYIAMAMHMLDLLVVERSSTNETVTGRVEGELNEPLEDIMREVAEMGATAQRDPELAHHVDRIRLDVEAIRRRMRTVAAGPSTLLGVERAMADRSHDPVLHGRRVLVADDDAAIRRLIVDVLRNRGCVVEECTSGRQAIDLLERIAAGEAPQVDVVLSDIKMQDHNGYEVFAASRRSGQGAPVILMTGFGYDPHHSIMRASQEGLQAVLFKPFQVDRLLDELRKALARQ